MRERLNGTPAFWMLSIRKDWDVHVGLEKDILGIGRHALDDKVPGKRVPEQKRGERVMILYGNYFVQKFMRDA